MGTAGVGQIGFSAGGQTSAGTSADSFGAGEDAQPAAIASSSAHPAAPIEDNGPMFWVFLEIFLALAVAVAIVWWTIPKKPKRDDEDVGR